MAFAGFAAYAAVQPIFKNTKEQSMTMTDPQPIDDERVTAHFAAAGITNDTIAAYREHIAGLSHCECGQPLLAPISIARGHCESCEWSRP